MWFKNATLYRLDPEFQRNPEAIADALAEQAFAPCGPMDPSRSGWYPPLGRLGTSLVHAANGFILICRRVEQKLLPADVIRDVLEERIEKIEDDEHRTVHAKEKRRLRDEITFELLPRAFVRHTDTFAYIDTTNG